MDSKRIAGLTVLLCLAGLPPCLAGEPLGSLLACRDVPDATARLACFDREAAALASARSTTQSMAAGAGNPSAPTAASGSPTAAQPANPSASAAPTTPSKPLLDATQKFGLAEGAVAEREVAAGTRAADIARISARVKSLSQSPNGLAIFTLDNGQVWRQLRAEGELLANNGDTVTILRGWLGSYYLQLPSGRGCKVTRVL